MRLEPSDLLGLACVADNVDGLAYSHRDRQLLGFVVDLGYRIKYGEQHLGVHAEGQIEHKEVVFAQNVLFDVLQRSQEDQNTSHAHFIVQETFAVVGIDAEHTLNYITFTFPR